MAAIPPVCDFGRPAPDFTLPATDGRTLSLADVTGEHGLVVVFMCNHCPYVKAILQPLVDDARTLLGLGIGFVAISSNDAAHYPEDSFPSMRALAEERAFPFPYLYDERQTVARAYEAICTPDFFGYDASLRLQYRGRLNASRRELVPGARRDLVLAMQEVIDHGRGPAEQVPSMGCTIKWRDDD